MWYCQQKGQEEMDNSLHICLCCYLRILESVHRIFTRIFCCLCSRISFWDNIERKALKSFGTTNHFSIEIYRFDLLDLHMYLLTKTNQWGTFKHIIDCDCQQNNHLGIWLSIDLKCCLQSKKLICYKQVNKLWLCYRCKFLVMCY